MRSKQRTALENKWHKSVADFATESNWLVNKFGGYFIPFSDYVIKAVL